MDEESGQEMEEREPEPAPKKIALKVPALFIKSVTNNKKVENGLTESKAEDGSTSTPRKPASRAMPASAKRKLHQQDNSLPVNEGPSEEPKSPADYQEEDQDNESDIDDSGSKGNAITSSTPPTKPKSRPMPASAKRKLSEKKQEVAAEIENLNNHEAKSDTEVDEGEDTGTVQDSNDEEPLDTSSQVNTTNSLDSAKSVQKKPMPASVRKKLEEKSNTSDSNEKSSQNDGEKAGPTQEASNKPKFSLSLGLGGIKLPTFSKPKVTVSPEPENDEEDGDSTDAGATKMKSSDLDDAKSEVSNDQSDTSDPKSDNSQRPGVGIGRRSGTSEFVSLEDPKHDCEICGTVFMNSYAKRKHILRIHEGIKEEKKQSKKKGTFEKVKTCPICFEKKVYANKKGFRDHVRKCKKPRKSCALCDKTFTSEKELIRHIKTHAGTSEKNGISDSKIDPQSIFDSNDISIPATPMSMRSEQDQGDDEVEAPPSPSSKDNSDTVKKSLPKSLDNDFIRKKFAQALTNFRQSKLGKSRESVPTPSEETSESIRGRPMPASLKKKIEERSSHEGNVKSRKNEPSNCRVCNMKLSNRANRRRHERTVHKFVEGESLGTQVPMALNPKPKPGKSDKECKFCGKKFIYVWTRRRHEQNVHMSKNSDSGSQKEKGTENELHPSDVGLIRCKVCFKAFNHKDSLRKHVKNKHPSESGLSPTKENSKVSVSVKDNKVCRFCGKKFPHRWNARRHERDVHVRKGHKVAHSTSQVQASLSPARTDEKQCRICKKMFFKKGNRQEHERKVHGKELGLIGSSKVKETAKSKRTLSVLECEVCHKMFSHAFRRRRHEKEVHKLVNSRSRHPPKEKVQDDSDGEEVESPEREEEDEREEEKPKEKFDLDSFTKKLGSRVPGRCPLCKKFIQCRLRRHILTVHKSELETSGEPDKEDTLPPPSPVEVSEEKSDEDIACRDEIRRHKEANHLLSTINWKIGGQCPICDQVAKTQLRLHFLRRHKLRKPIDLSKGIPTVSSPTNNYKIYRSAADKLKNRFVPSRINLSRERTQEVKEVPKENSSTNTSSSPSTRFDCACCDQVFEIEDVYEEHKALRQPKKKSYIACKICWHMFSHQDDFLLHMKFIHKDISGKVSTFKKEPKLGDAKSTRERLVTRTERLENPPAEPPKSRKNSSLSAFGSYVKLPTCFVKISEEDMRLAKDQLERVKDQRSEKSKIEIRNKLKLNGRIKRRPSKKSPTPEPEPMDMDDDDNDNFEPLNDTQDDYNSDSQMDDEPNISITSTFSQKQNHTSERRRSMTSSYGLNEMPCGTCKEVFYSFEALRKHELYFHNVKTSKMCPICGAFPFKLSRHLIAHENKTVRCSCGPCGLTFGEFKELREHNLKIHPSPGVTIEPVNEPEPIKMKESKEVDPEGSYRCLICMKGFDGSKYVRTHIRRTHCHLEDDPSNHIERIEREEKSSKEDETELRDILEDTNQKLMDSDWGDNSDMEVEEAETPKSEPAQIEPLEAEPPKKTRAMPASIRAKLDALKRKKAEDEEKRKKQEAEEEENRKRDEERETRVRDESGSDEDEVVEVKTIERDESAESDEEKETSQAAQRPMPQSIRARLEELKRKKKIVEDQMTKSHVTTTSDDSQSPSDERKDKPKPSRPMPASVRAKLMTQDKSDCDSTTPARPRPMPASAKLKNKAELKEIHTVPDESDKGASDNDMDDPDYSPDSVEVEGTPLSPPSPLNPAAVEDNDDDDVQVLDESTKSNEAEAGKDSSKSKADDVIVLSDDEGPPLDTSVPVESSMTIEDNEVQDQNQTQSTPEKLAEEHDRAVRIAMGEINPSQGGLNVIVTYQCKLCSKTFDALDSIRRHIRRAHSEYGAEHTENLIEQIYEETFTETTEDLSRKRRRVTRYTEEEYLDAHDEIEEDDEEAEVIIRRGTSTRKNAARHDDEDYSPEISGPKPRNSQHVLPEGVVGYACEFCGKRMNTPGNIRRHIHKAHPEMFKKVKSGAVSGVVVVTPGMELPEPPIQKTKPASQLQRHLIPKDAKGFRCRICHWKMEKYHGIYQHVRRTHPEVSNERGSAGNYIEPMREDSEGGHTITWGGETEDEVTSFSCILCNYVTSDEHDYVRHYKKHTGKSPYQCQYCAGTFNKNSQLLSHMEREHTGAEFLNLDEEEFSMEEMTGINEIQVSATARIQIEQPKVISLNRRQSKEKSPEKNGHSAQEDGDDDSDDEKETDTKKRPGPASRVKAVKTQPASPTRDDSDGGSSPPSPMDDNPPSPAASEPEKEQTHESVAESEEEIPVPPQRKQGGSEGFQFQGDLSSLFSTLGGEGTPGGLEALDDISGGMSLD